MKIDRWRRRILVLGGAVCFVAVLLASIRHYQLRWAVDRYLEKLRAAGEPLELAQVIPPPLSPDKNSAALFMKAASELATNGTVLQSNEPLAMHMIARGSAAIGWREPDIHWYATNSWEDVRNALDQDREALSLLGEITNGAVFDFDLKWSQRYEMLLKHLSLERRAMDALTAEELYNLHMGNEASGYRSVRVMLALIKGTRDEWTAISQMVRALITQSAAASTWELLQGTKVSDGELAQLQDDWLGLEFVPVAEPVVRVERESVVSSSEQFRNPDAAIAHYRDLLKQFPDRDSLDTEDSIWQNLRWKARILRWRYWWSYTDEIRTLQVYDVFSDAWRTVEESNSFRSACLKVDSALVGLGTPIDRSYDIPLHGPSDFPSAMAVSVAGFEWKFMKRTMQAETARQTVVAAIALKRYRLKYGKYPPRLDMLRGEFLAKTPTDPVDGQPLRYRLTADGEFLLYSVGENGVDDGGDPSLKKGASSASLSWLNPSALDWVLPRAVGDR